MAKKRISRACFKRVLELTDTLSGVFNKSFMVFAEDDFTISIDKRWSITEGVLNNKGSWFVERAEVIHQYPYAPDDVDIVEVGDVSCWNYAVDLLVKDIASTLLREYMDKRADDAAAKEYEESKKFKLGL